MDERQKIKCPACLQKTLLDYDWDLLGKRLECPCGAAWCWEWESSEFEGHSHPELVGYGER